MKKSALPLFVLCICVSCHKSNDKREPEHKKCYSGRYVAAGCNSTSVVQIISPKEQILEQSTFQLTGQSPIFDYAVSTIIPDSLRSGKIFYFNVKSLTKIGITTQDCIWPKYSAAISNLTTFGCDSILLYHR